jgi:hypothetical protein
MRARGLGRRAVGGAFTGVTTGLTMGLPAANAIIAGTGSATYQLLFGQLPPMEEK